MPKPKWNLNTIYISERLQEPAAYFPLRHDDSGRAHGLWKNHSGELVSRRARQSGTLRIIRISVYSGNLAIFWKSVQEAFARAGFTFLREYPCPTDAAGGGLLVDDLCHMLAGESPCYIFIDDFHLLTDKRAPCSFVCWQIGCLPMCI